MLMFSAMILIVVLMVLIPSLWGQDEYRYFFNATCNWRQLERFIYIRENNQEIKNNPDYLCLHINQYDINCT